MEKIESELSPEELETLRLQCEKVVAVFTEFWNEIQEVVKVFLEKVREIAINLARFFLKMQLLECKIPYPIAHWLSEKVNSYWTMQIGFAWLRRKFVL